MGRIYDFYQLREDKQLNVLVAFELEETHGDVLYVIDDTILGSCKDGMVLTSGYLVSKISGRVFFYDLDACESISSKNGKVFFNNRLIRELYFPDNDELENFFDFVSRKLGEQSSGNDGENIEDIFNSVDGNIFAVLGYMLPKIAEEYVKVAGSPAEVNDVEVWRNFSSSLLEESLLAWGKIVDLGGDVFKRADFGELRLIGPALALLTHAAAYIFHILEKEAKFNYDQAMRYAQYPFLLIGILIKIAEENDGGESEGGDSIASIVGGRVDRGYFTRYQICDRVFGRISLCMNDNVKVAEITMNLMANMSRMDKSISSSVESKFSQLASDEDVLSTIDEILVVFEKSVKRHLIAALKHFTKQSNKFPKMLGLEQIPQELRYSENTDGMEKRVY